MNVSNSNIKLRKQGFIPKPTTINSLLTLMKYANTFILKVLTQDIKRATDTIAMMTSVDSIKYIIAFARIHPIVTKDTNHVTKAKVNFEIASEIDSTVSFNKPILCCDRRPR